MITVTRYASDGRGFRTGGEELLEEPAQPGGKVWIDVLAPTPEVMEGLAKQFGLHRLAVEDCLHLDQRPKLEEYPNHLLVVLHGFTRAPEDLTDLRLHEMHFLLAADWLITVHELPSHAVEVARKRMEADPEKTLGRGVDFAAYLVADALVDQNFPLVDDFNDVLDDLEDAIFEGADQAQLQRIFQLKRALVSIRRVLSPQRDVVGLLSRSGVPHIQDRSTLYFRDIYDHLIRLHEQIEAGRDLIGNAMEAYLSVMANRTNDITKQLTIFATIFLPLSFITGFFGQNFDVLYSRPLFAVMLTSIVGLPVALLLWFRKQGWL